MPKSKLYYMDQEKFRTEEQVAVFVVRIFERINDEVFGGKFSVFVSEDKQNIKLMNTLYSGDIQSIYFTYNPPDGIWVEPIVLEPWFEITIKQIKDIYLPVSNRGPEANDYITTFDNTFGALYDHYEKGYNTVHLPMTEVLYEANALKDFDTIVNSMIPFVSKYVVRYFDENTSVSRADLLLNTEPEGFSLHTYLGPTRATMGLIAAKLVHNPNYESLKKIYVDKMRDATGNTKTDFMKAIDYIDTKDFSNLDTY